MKKIILLILIILPVIAFAQKSRVLKGKVVGESDGLPLPGASVYIDKNIIGEQTELEGVIKNFSLGTTTNIDGEFTFTVPDDRIEFLLCSFIGYETAKVNIKGKDFVLIKLKDENKVLKEVVVTGYQKIEKRKVTSSVVKVKTDAIMQAGVASVDHMLDGQLAGVQTTMTNGAPGAPAKIRIRGTASLQGTQDPLWVLDGMPLEGTDLPDMEGKNIDNLVNSSIAGLNPSDIADITILKDAAATAIYGARAANGVIVITTKKGKKGRLSVNFNTNMSVVMRPDMDMLNLMNSGEKLDMELNLARFSDLSSDNVNTSKGAIARLFAQHNITNWGVDSKVSDLPAEVQSEISRFRQINTNWGNELYQTAVNQDHSLSISGGSDRVNYYFSLGYHDEKGTTIGTGMDRFNITMKADFKLADNFTFGAAIYANERNQETYLTGAGAFTNPSRYSRSANPYLAIYDKDGEYVYDPDINIFNDVLIPFNIIEERNNTSNEMKTQNVNAVFDVDWKLRKGLSLRSQFGLQRDYSNTEQFAGKNSYYARLQREKSRIGDDYFIPEGGIIKNWENTLSQWNWKTMLEYNLNFNDMHEVDLMAGTELRRTESRIINSAAYGFNKETLTSQYVAFPDQDKADQFPLFKKSYQENAYVSFFGTFAYTYNKKYTFFGSVRMDGSDLFGVDPKYRYLPLWAASGAWRAKQEPWLYDVEWLTDLKFRFSYGLQGNIDKNTSKFIVGVKDITEILPGNIENVILPTSLPNDRLRWEKTATWNAGFDLGLIKNIFRVSADFYNRKSTDLIGVRTMPLENGMSSASINWAALTNKGFEINLITRNVYTEDFKWQTTFNISKNINTVDKIHIPDNQVTPSLKGHSVNSLFAFKTAGLDEQGYMLFPKDGEKVTADKYFGLEDAWGIGYFTPTYNNEQYRDLYTHVGTTDPDLSGGLINKFTYKNFTLNVSCSFNIGQTVKLDPFYDIIQMDRGVNRTTMMNEVWSPLNKTGKYPRMIGQATEDYSRQGDFSAFNTQMSLPFDVFRNLDIWYKDVNYLRINSIRLAYKVPDSFVSKLGINSARLNVEARNPFVIASDYEGYFDPETLGNIYAQPMPKSFTVGLNVTF